jgi:hypothetical protein
MNNIRTTAAALLILLILPARATARIGETLAQCQTRYGPPVEISEKNLWAFRKDDLVIACSFDPPADAPTAPATCTAICYRLQPAGSVIGRPIPPRLVTAFLKINGAADWPDDRGVTGTAPADHWWTQPGVGMAGLFGAPDYTLVIILQRRLDMQRTTEKTALDDLLKGL